jgi:hypothetical protein
VLLLGRVRQVLLALAEVADALLFGRFRRQFFLSLGEALVALRGLGGVLALVGHAPVLTIRRAADANNAGNPDVKAG